MYVLARAGRQRLAVRHCLGRGDYGVVVVISVVGWFNVSLAVGNDYLRNVPSTFNRASDKPEPRPALYRQISNQPTANAGGGLVGA